MFRVGKSAQSQICFRYHRKDRPVNFTESLNSDRFAQPEQPIITKASQKPDDNAR